MPFNCVRCGAEGSVKEHDTDTMPRADFANIDLFPEYLEHTFNVLYDRPPWRCESCKTVYFRGSTGKFRKDINKTCKLCGKGRLEEHENVDIGEVVIKNSYDKIGEFTVDEAIVCNSCGYMTIIETSVETE